MSTAAAERFFSLLALIAGAGAIAIVIARFVPAARPLLARLSDGALWLAWLVAATATFGSLWFSEVADFTPCKLCWYQRIVLYPFAVVLLIAAVRRDRGIVRYAAPMAGIGLLIGFYHYLIEWNPQWEATSCDLAAPCTAVWYREFGFVTLSFSSMCASAAILALLLCTKVISSDGQQARS